jgi:DNA-binding Xre family transcriptional regulator
VGDALFIDGVYNEQIDRVVSVEARPDLNRGFCFFKAQGAVVVKIKIKEAAKDRKDWSLYRLAKELGLPQQTVYSWASGRTQPSYDNMDRLCDALDCSVGELFESEPVQQRLF